MLRGMSSTANSYATRGAETDDRGADPLAIASFDLPPPDTKRWVIRRKAVVVAAVRSGALSVQEACRRYKLSLEEFLAWQRAIDRHGVPGLRVTRLQLYRDAGMLRPGK